MVTPSHIVPEWYFLPFYAMLRAIPDKLGGVIIMIFSILILLFIPLIGSTSSLRSSDFRPIYKFFFWYLVFSFLLLGWLGACPVEEPYIFLSRLFTFYYFLFFLVLMPLIGLLESYLLKSVLHRHSYTNTLNKTTNKFFFNAHGFRSNYFFNNNYFLTRYNYHKRS
jgi:ubiquinol-cytochrome c reductase cytochrome b subunit